MVLNSNSPVSQVVSANPNTETEIAKFDFRPTDDKAQIQELLLVNGGAAQVDDITPAVVEIGDTFTVTINGTSVSFVATVATVANVTAGLTAAINGNATLSALVTAVDNTTKVTIT
jgi:L-cystine uptake protein TcyP (sodium:dicarboxylate symporter family)